MPELPEVETVRQVLRKRIIGKTIAGVVVRYDKIIHGNTVEEFTKLLNGRTIKEINRLGKYLFFDLDGLYMISHLRMEGKYFIKKSDEEYVKHEHIIFNFTDGWDLRYHDVRKFGVMEIKYPYNLYTTHPLADLGMEATTLDGAYLFDKLKNKKGPIKPILLDQEIVAGIGNIYADEICFAAKINPACEVNKITLDDCMKIALASKNIMAKAILAGGSTIRSYSSLGVTGLYQEQLMVHTRENLPCYVCKTLIIKTKIGGRGTYYCPICQKNK